MTKARSGKSRFELSRREAALAVCYGCAVIDLAVRGVHHGHVGVEHMRAAVN